MKRILILIILLSVLAPVSVSAAESTVPPVPDQGAKYMPENTESFVDGLLEILLDITGIVAPALRGASRVCASIIAVTMIVSLVNQFAESADGLSETVGCLIIVSILLENTNTMILLGIDTVKEITSYGNLLLPVLTSALAAQGGAGSSAALYTGTSIFTTVLSWLISAILRPLLYIYICFIIIKCLTSETIIDHAADFIKWLFTWSLKISLYIFTGYMSITGAISGSTDVARLKATKLTLSGMVPVVGGILSDVSESILVSAGVLKSSVGVYGMLAIIAMCIEPFVTVGIQYLLLKATTAVCQLFSCKQIYDLSKSFASTFGFVLAVIGSVCLMLLVSVVCFMKAVT